MIRNLERLEFGLMIEQDDKGEQFSQVLASLGQRLGDREITKALKELIIVVHPHDYLTWDDVVLSLASSEEWEVLDAVQWSSTLQKVCIYVNHLKMYTPPGNAAEQLQLLMQPRLPRLTERGILLAGVGTHDDFEVLGWLRVWD